MEEIERLNLKKKAKNVGSKSANFSTVPKTGDIQMVEAALTPVLIEEPKEITDEDINNAIVYTNEVTSIDFMMPEQEREILEKNLNQYGDLEKMQKVLSIAKKNKKLSEDIKTLELISKTGQLSNRLFELMLNEKNIEVLEKYMQRKFDEGDIAKAYKEVGTVSKIILDARQEMVKGLNPKSNNKSARIALKFTNDDGDEFQLGVDV